MKLLSIIVPCFNEQESIPIFYNEVMKVSQKLKDSLDVEIVFVNDGSIDDTLNVLKELNKKDKRARYVSFSRNFGKESAMFAGLESSKGDYVAIMDVDLQDPPELLVDMYNYIKEEDYDCIATRRISRKGEPPIRSFFARRFYSIINKISKTEIIDGARDYRMMTRQMFDSIISLK